jgi:hypothetical protein
MSGAKIIEGLKDAVAGNFSAVTIEGQRWVRVDGYPSKAAMIEAVALEIEAAIGKVQTVAIGRLIQKAIDAQLPGG